MTSEEAWHITNLIAKMVAQDPEGFMEVVRNSISPSVQSPVINTFNNMGMPSLGFGFDFGLGVGVGFGVGIVNPLVEIEIPYACGAVKKVVVRVIGTIVAAIYGYQQSGNTASPNVKPAATTSSRPATTTTQVQRLNNRLTTNQNQLNHMFADRSGHFRHNTEVNRALITNTANNRNNFMGTDIHGNQIFAQTQANGTQVWARVRDGVITEAGINQTPRSFDSETGLNQPRNR